MLIKAVMSKKLSRKACSAAGRVPAQRYILNVISSSFFVHI